MGSGSGFGVLPEKVRQVGQQVVQISQDVGSIVSSGAATIQLDLPHEGGLAPA